MTNSKDDLLETLPDEKIIDLPSTSVSAEQAVELQRRIAELDEDSLWEDDPEFHGLPLFRNLRLQREKDQERKEKDAEVRRNDSKRSKQALEDNEFQVLMTKFVINFGAVAKRACRCGAVLLLQELEIRSRAIVLDDGCRVYVDGSNFIDEKGERLDDPDAIADADKKKSANSATAHELQIASQAHILAEQEINVAQQASRNARDAELSKKSSSAMTPEEQTAAVASAGKHGDELERAQSATERRAKDLMNSNTASLATRAVLPAIAGALPSASSVIGSVLRNKFESANESTSVSIGASGLGPAALSLKNEFSIAIASPRNDNSSGTRETAASDSILPVRPVIL